MKSIRYWIVNRWSVALCTLALLCVPAVLVHAQDYDAAARDQVIALEKAWNQAYKAGDTKALAAILDNSLILVEDDGSLKTKSEFLASVNSSSGNDASLIPGSRKTAPGSASPPTPLRSRTAALETCSFPHAPQKPSQFQAVRAYWSSA